MKFGSMIPEQQHHSRFDALMDLFEHNYILIRRLLGDLRRLQPGDEFPLSTRLQAYVVDRGRFTLTIRFTDHEVLTRDGRPASLTVRVYLDARTAEMFGPQDRAACLADRQNICVDKQRQRNQFLRRWLISLLGANQNN